MEICPTSDAVHQGILTLYNNPDSKEKEKANKWLEEFQKSIYSWSIADELLRQKRDLHSCYFAAQTMRNKIQNSFHELPSTAHNDLRDSLVAHIEQTTQETSPVILTQLCLAISDLALLMPTWKDSIKSLIEKFSNCPGTILPLIEILTLIPEEIDSRKLRLGANRRNEIRKQLEENCSLVVDFLVGCHGTYNQNTQIIDKIIKCYNSWLSIYAIPFSTCLENPIVQQVFVILSTPSPLQLHETSTDFLCTLLQCLESYDFGTTVELQLFQAIIALESFYHESVAKEEFDKAVNYCRIFTTLGESLLEKIVSDDKNPHYSIKSLDLVLTCFGHYDYEIAEISFNFWYRLSEELYQKNNDELINHFKPYIERLISALYRHSQMDSDHEGLIDETDSFYDFRRKVSGLIKDVVFIVGSSSCFKQMFLLLQDPSVTWEGSESALFIMENVAKNMLPDENEIVPKVIEAILNLKDNTHLAFRYTAIMLLGELCDWINSHPETLQSILNFLLFSLQQKNGLASAAAVALTSICTACKTHIICHFNGLIEIARSLDSFEISNELAIGLLKSIAIVLTYLPINQLEISLNEICGFQFGPLIDITKSPNNTVNKGSRTDPVYWIDRACAIIRHILPNIGPNEIHPVVRILTDSWPVIASVFDKYQTDSRIMERTCRFIRYGIRSVGKQASHLLEPLVKHIVCLYELHQHSCFLYLGSILVDEFAVLDDCRNGLLEMLKAFIDPTFNQLQVENGLKNNPDTVDDFFRLCSRFIEYCPLQLLQSHLVTPIIQCALLACTLDHHEANMSVMKFFINLLKCGHPDAKNPLTKHLVKTIIIQNGEALVMNLIHASVFCLHSYQLCDVAEVLTELKAVDSENIEKFLKNSLNALPKKNSAGYITATQQQLDEFCNDVLRSTTTKQVTYALKEFTRLYR